jgi:hypothetical protein
MGNMPGPEHKPNGEPTRLLLSLNAWGASSKSDAKKKAAAMGSVNKGLPSALASNGVVRSKSLAYGLHATGRVVANQEGRELARGMAKLGPAEQKIVRRMAVKPIKPDTDDIKTLKASLKSGKKGRKQALDISRFAGVRPSSSYKASGVGKAAAMGSVDKGLPSALRNANRGLSSPGYTRNRLSANWWGNRASKEIAIKKIPVIQESGVDMRRKIASIKSSKNMGKDYKYLARKDLWRTPVQSSYKKSGVGKSMEYSVDMNSVNKSLVSRGSAHMGAALEWKPITQATPRELRSIKNKNYGSFTDQARERDLDVFREKVKRRAERSATGAKTSPLKARTQAAQDERFERGYGKSGQSSVAGKLRGGSGNRTTAVDFPVGHPDRLQKNQSRFGGASAVGKSFVEKADKVHYADKLIAEVANLAGQINQKAPELAYRKGVRTGMRHNAKVLIPIGAAGGSAVTAAGMTAHNNRKQKPMPVVVVKADEVAYDQMGQPVQQKKRNPLSEMSGNAKLGAAGAGIGLVGAKRMAFAGTLPSQLKSQSEGAAQKVAFQERLANDQLKRVQSATQIKNPFTRRKQVNLNQYYSDKAQGSLANARANQIQADNALKAAPAKRAAHLKSGGALVATGAAMGGLAAYNNAKERKLKGRVK